MNANMLTRVILAVAVAVQPVNACFAADPPSVVALDPGAYEHSLAQNRYGRLGYRSGTDLCPTFSCAKLDASQSAAGGGMAPAPAPAPAAGGGFAASTWILIVVVVVVVAVAAGGGAYGGGGGGGGNCGYSCPP